MSSWNSKTPAGTWIQSEVQPKLDNGTVVKWYILGRWSYGDSDFHRTSVGAIKSTNGHLLVIGGFTGNGNVIAYDPAHDTDAEVRQVYDRTEFERAWIPTSGGIVYVIRPAGHALPSLTANNS